MCAKKFTWIIWDELQSILPYRTSTHEKMRAYPIASSFGGIKHH